MATLESRLLSLVTLIGSDIKVLLANSLKTGDTVTLSDSMARFLRVNVVDSPGDSNDTNWPDRLAFYFKGTLAGYFNEKGEIRARPATVSTVALRALGALIPNNVDIFQVTDSMPTDIYFRVSKNNASATVPLTAPNISSNKFQTGSTAPVDPAVGDAWVPWP